MSQSFITNFYQNKGFACQIRARAALTCGDPFVGQKQPSSPRSPPGGKLITPK